MSVIMEDMRMHSEPEEGASTVTVGAAASDLGPLSPELALVDPGLARAARALLPDPATVAPPAPVERPALAVRPRPAVRPVPVAPPEPAVPPPARLVPERVPEATGSKTDVRRPRRARRVGWAAAAVGVVGALAFFLLPERDGPPATVVVSPSGPAVERPEPSTPEATPPTTASAPPTPAPGVQTFVWAPSPGAAAYEFQLFRARARIFRIRVTEPRLELPQRWRQGGRAHTLEPGSYRWYVWPISAETQRQSRVATVQARLVIDD